VLLGQQASEQVMSSNSGVVQTVSKAPQAAVATDWLSVALFMVHAAIVGYVVAGWTAQTRVGLFVYLLLLPMLVLQWLVNGGSSIVSNIETYKRTGHWRHAEQGLEGAFFQSVLRSVGLEATKAQINTVVVVTMFLFWVVAFFRLILIAPSL
jgi:hypothetical protein